MLIGNRDPLADVSKAFLFRDAKPLTVRGQMI